MVLRGSGFCAPEPFGIRSNRDAMRYCKVNFDMDVAPLLQRIRAIGFQGYTAGNHGAKIHRIGHLQGMNKHMELMVPRSSERIREQT